MLSWARMARHAMTNQSTVWAKVKTIASAAKPLKFEPETFKFIASFYIVLSKDGRTEGTELNAWVGMKALGWSSSKPFFGASAPTMSETKESKNGSYADFPHNNDSQTSAA